MATKEDNKWHMYFVYAVILAIFGMVIYLVVVGQQTEDQYYLTITFRSDESGTSVIAPTYPTGANGTLKGGVNAVRDALVSKVDSLDGVNLSISGSGSWSFAAHPRLNDAGDTPDYYWSYTFPAPGEMTTNASVLEQIVNNDYDVNKFFSEASVDVQDWAAATFTDASQPVTVSIAYGNRAAATAAAVA